jgi:hypothetical protein
MSRLTLEDCAEAYFEGNRAQMHPDASGADCPYDKDGVLRRFWEDGFSGRPLNLDLDAAPPMFGTGTVALPKDDVQYVTVTLKVPGEDAPPSAPAPYPELAEKASGEWLLRQLSYLLDPLKPEEAAKARVVISELRKRLAHR